MLLAQLTGIVRNLHKIADDDAQALTPETQLALAGLLPMQDQMRQCQKSLEALRPPGVTGKLNGGSRAPPSRPLKRIATIDANA